MFSNRICSHFAMLRFTSRKTEMKLHSHFVFHALYLSLFAHKESSHCLLYLNVRKSSKGMTTVPSLESIFSIRKLNIGTISSVYLNKECVSDLRNLQIRDAPGRFHYLRQGPLEKERLNLILSQTLRFSAFSLSQLLSLFSYGQRKEQMRKREGKDEREERKREKARKGEKAVRKSSSRRPPFSLISSLFLSLFSHCYSVNNTH